MHWLPSFFLHYRLFIQDYGLFGIAFSVAVENLGVPLPTEPAYIVGTMMISHGQASVAEVLLFLYVGHTVGSLISYVAGRRIAKTMIGREKFTDTQHKIAGWYDKYGPLTVFATRLIGYVRPWSSYVAGIAEVKFWPFFLLSSLGTFILNLVCLAFTKQFIHLWHNYPVARVLISASFLVGIIIVVWGIYKKRSSPGKTI